MMASQISLSLLLLALTSTFAAPADPDSEQIIINKRAALVLDRLLVALSRALQEKQPADFIDEGPRTAPLRTVYADDVSALQRRGLAGSTRRGVSPKCYFNPVTCF